MLLLDFFVFLCRASLCQCFGTATANILFVSRPEIGFVPSPGQNPAEFILLAAAKANITGFRGPDRDQEYTADRSREPSSRSDRVSVGGIGGVVYLYEDEEYEEDKEAGGEKGEEQEVEEGGRAEVLTRELRRVWKGERTYAVGFCAQVTVVGVHTYVYIFVFFLFYLYVFVCVSSH